MKQGVAEVNEIEIDGKTRDLMRNRVDRCGLAVKFAAMQQTIANGMPPPLSVLSAAGPIALFLDFDGTLIDIAPTPDAIKVPLGLAKGLEALSLRHSGRVALVSGRSTKSIVSHLGLATVALAGSHGIERLRADGQRIGEQPERLPDEVEQAVRAFTDRHDGLEFERKSHGTAVHYRAAPELGAAAIAFGEELAEAYGLQVKLGKCVVELVHRGADKAGAVHAFMAEEAFSGATPIFIGDDLTDEDGFRAANELGGFGVLVGERPDTLARYRLSSPAKVREWLELQT